jgi:hypothetical protein
MTSNQNVLFINGRFLGQPFSGVQRFAREISSALLTIRPLDTSVLVPRNVPCSDDKIQQVGSRHGQAWEQIDLPRYAKRGILLNLGNTAPLMSRRQVVVIHDAGVFANPEAYSWHFRMWS